MTIKPEIYLMAGGAVLLALMLAGKNAGTAGYSVGSAAVDMVDGVLSGTVLTVGDKLGLPRTDEERGRDALAQGDYWNASFLLPAGDFIAGAWNRLTN